MGIACIGIEIATEMETSKNNSAPGKSSGEKVLHSKPHERMHLKVPLGLDELLTIISRQVLKDQPKQLVPFIANHLRKMVNIREGRRESLNDLSRMQTGIPTPLDV